MEKFELPTEVKSKISKLMEHFDLQYGSIDFLEIENGELTFLELNPTGAFGWIDQAY